MKVSYTKDMRQRALGMRAGLITVHVLEPGKKPGKFGGGITIQGPASEEECMQLAKFAIALIKKKHET
jgi:hypothetical protein